MDINWFKWIYCINIANNLCYILRKSKNHRIWKLNPLLQMFPGFASQWCPMVQARDFMGWSSSGGPGPPLWKIWGKSIGMIRNPTLMGKYNWCSKPPTSCMNAVYYWTIYDTVLFIMVWSNHWVRITTLDVHSSQLYFCAKLAASFAMMLEKLENTAEQCCWSDHTPSLKSLRFLLGVFPGVAIECKGHGVSCRFPFNHCGKWPLLLCKQLGGSNPTSLRGAAWGNLKWIVNILWMREIPHPLGWLKPYQ